MSTPRGYSYMSSSYSSSTSTGPDGQPHTQVYAKSMSSNDQDGTVVHRKREETGKTPVEETETHPGGKRVMDDDAGRKEDVSEEQHARDREYEERMEDEYAKREGGA